MAVAKKNSLAKLNPAAKAGVVLLMLLLPAIGYLLPAYYVTPQFPELQLRRRGDWLLIAWVVGAGCSAMGLLFAERLDFSVGPAIGLFLGGSLSSVSSFPTRE